MRKRRKKMVNIIDMGRVVEGDDTALDGTGVTSKKQEVAAKDLPEGTMMEITQPGTDKTYKFPALALAGGDYHKVIQASDGTIPEEDIKRYYDIAMKMDWQDGWYSSEQMKKEAKTPGYKHIHLGGSDTEEVEYEIEQDWVKEIWDAVDPGNVKLLRHYLNGHHANQSGGIHLDGWTGNQYTVILYLTPDMTPDDGGALEIWTPNITDEMKAMAINTPYGFGGPKEHEVEVSKSYWPKPGRYVVLDARLPHVARAVENDKFRVSLVFKGISLDAPDPEDITFSVAE